MVLGPCTLLSFRYFIVENFRGCLLVQSNNHARNMPISESLMTSEADCNDYVCATTQKT